MRLPEILPLVAIRGQAEFPDTRFTLRVGRDRSIRALEESGCVLLVAQRDPAVDDPQPADLHETGIVADIQEIETLPDHSLQVMLQSRGRARVVEHLQTAPFHRVRIEILDLLPEDNVGREPDELLRSIRRAFHQIATATGTVPSDAVSELLNTDEPGSLAHKIATYLPLPAAVQRELAAVATGRERLEKLQRLLADAETLRAGLVEALTASHTMPTAACRRAFLRVPRHRFVPAIPTAAAYVDTAITTHTRNEQGREVGISSISAPCIIAANVGQLRLRPGLRVLEIGAGTGYNAAILAEIVGADNVTSVDLDPEIVAEARSHLDATGYHRVLVDVADGWDGYPERSPYDRILLTVGVADIAPAWVEQLREGGLLVGWFSFRNLQLSIAFRKRNGCLLSESISGPLWSIDMRGKQPRRLTHHQGDMAVISDALEDADLAILDEILDRPAEPFSVPELEHLGAATLGFYAFLALAHPLALQISDPRVKAQGIEGAAYALAGLQRRQLAVPTACFGGPEIGEEFRRLARDWLALGRPALERLVLAAYPRTAYLGAGALTPGRWIGLVEKEHTWFRWRYRRPARAWRERDQMLNSLSETEQQLWHRLAVFAGDFTQEAVEAVCSGEGIEQSEIAGLLRRLADLRVVLVMEEGDETSYRLPEPLRGEALAHLKHSEEADTRQERLAAYYVELSEQARLKLNSADRAAWLGRLEREYENLGTALRWLAGRGRADEGLRLIIGLRDFWRWHLCDGRKWFAQLLALPEASVRTVLRARALDDAATLAFYVLYQRDDLFSPDAQRDYAAYRSLAQESLAILRELGEHWHIANVLGHMATGVRLLEGDPFRARALFEESLAIWRELGDKPSIAYALGNLACLAIDQGDHPAARLLVEESANLATWDGWITGLLDSAARYAASHGQAERALRLAGATAAHREVLRVPPFLQERMERSLQAARSTLDGTTQAIAWREGRAMTLSQAVTYALAEPGTDASMPRYRLNPPALSGARTESTSYPEG